MPARILLIAPADLVPLKEKEERKKRLRSARPRSRVPSTCEDLDLGLGPPMKVIFPRAPIESELDILFKYFYQR